MRLLMNLPDHRLELLNNRTHVFERFYVGNPEFHAKFHFDRNDKVNVVKRVPVSELLPVWYPLSAQLYRPTKYP